MSRALILDVITKKNGEVKAKFRDLYHKLQHFKFSDEELVLIYKQLQVYFKLQSEKKKEIG